MFGDNLFKKHTYARGLHNFFLRRKHWWRGYSQNFCLQHLQYVSILAYVYQLFVSFILSAMHAGNIYFVTMYNKHKQRLNQYSGSVVKTTSGHKHVWSCWCKRPPFYFIGLTLLCGFTKLFIAWWNKMQSNSRISAHVRTDTPTHIPMLPPISEMKFTN